jgi:hypothetical protein
MRKMTVSSGRGYKGNMYTVLIMVNYHQGTLPCSNRWLHDMSVGNFLRKVTVSWNELVHGTLFKTGESTWRTSCKKEKINTEKRKKRENEERD